VIRAAVAIALAAAVLAPAVAFAQPEEPHSLEVGATEGVDPEAGHHEAPHPPEVNWFTGLFDLSHQKMDAEGGTLESGEAPMAPPFAAVLINFAIFLGLLVWKAGPPVRNYLRNRHGEISTALAEAARIEKEAAERLDEYDRKLAAVGAEVDELIEGMRTDAESERQRLIADAEATAQALKQSAQDRIEASIGRARLAIEAEVAAAAVAAAERVLREKMNDNDHNKLVDSFIASLEAGQFGPPSGGSGRARRDSTVIDEGWS
jgi:F-type H+-transporting ATPase subunit b